MMGQPTSYDQPFTRYRFGGPFFPKRGILPTKRYFRLFFSNSTHHLAITGTLLCQNQQKPKCFRDFRMPKLLQKLSLELWHKLWHSFQVWKRHFKECQRCFQGQNSEFVVCTPQVQPRLCDLGRLWWTHTGADKNKVHGSLRVSLIESTNKIAILNGFLV